MWKAWKVILPVGGLQASGQQSTAHEELLGMLSCMTLLVTATIVAICLWKRRPKGFPSGPKGIPFVGNALQLNRNFPHLSLSDLAKQFGDVYSINLFGKWFVVLSGEKTIREALVTQSAAFAGRPYSFRAHYMANFSSQVTFDSYTRKWQWMKKLMMSSLHAYGGGMGRLETMMLSVITDVIAEIDSQEQQAFDPFDLIRSTFTNMIAMVVYGKRLEQPRLETLLNVERPLMECNVPMGKGAELDIFPQLRYLGNTTFERLKFLKKEVKSWFDMQFTECMIRSGDSMLKTMVLEILNHSKMDEKPKLDEGDLKGMTQDLMFAGIITSSTLVYEGLAMMICKPDLQERLRKEIKTKLGSRSPSMEDKAQLPLMMATIYELLRFMSHVPLAIAHATTSDVNMGESCIPGGTGVLINLWNLHHDERYWDDPWLFNPDRFLSSDGRLLPPDHPNHRRLLAFGAGLRICPGKSLAIHRIFLMLTLLLKNFKFLPPEGDTLPNIDPRSFTMGIVLCPDRFNLRAVREDVAA